MMGYKAGETEYRGRVRDPIFSPSEMKKRSRSNWIQSQVQKTGNFIIWESDSLGYTPHDIDTSNLRLL